jgi:hypothetical protein
LIDVLANGGDSGQTVHISQLRIASDLNRARYITDNRLETIKIRKRLVFQHMQRHPTLAFANRAHASKSIDVCQVRVVGDRDSTTY